MERKILCTCLSGLYVSPLFAALLRQALDQAGHKIKVDRVGLAKKNIGEPVSGAVQTCLGEIGLETGEVVRHIDDVNLGAYSCILCMNQEAADKVAGICTPDKKRIIVVNSGQGIIDPGNNHLPTCKQISRIITNVIREMVGDIANE